ncbi:MAG: MFS transporter [Thermomicrobiales bacterium]|nr:MFS transporter [Thermomicrobiales bacterium]
MRLWLAQAISQTASNMINFALLVRVRNIVEIHDLRQANTAISLVIIAFSLPAILFGPLAGVLADRVNRRRMMAATNIVRSAAVLCFLLIRPGWHVETILVATYLVTFLFGIGGQFFAPAQGASIPSLVPRSQLISANALFNLTNALAQLLGLATIGPLLVKLFGVDIVFALSVALFLVCAGLVLTLPSMPPIQRPLDHVTAAPMKRLWKDIKEGLVFILQDAFLMRSIVYLTLAATTFLMVATLGPAFITSEIGLPKEDFLYIIAPAGLGIVFGVATVGRVVKAFSRSAVIDWSLTMAGVMLFLLAIGPNMLDLLWTGGDAPQRVLILVTAGFAALLGLCNAFILVPANTMLQEHSHEHVRARVYATFFMISNAVSFIPIFFAAAFADLFGVVTILVVVAVLIGSIGATSVLQSKTAEAARWRRLRTRHREGPESISLDPRRR